MSGGVEGSGGRPLVRFFQALAAQLAGTADGQPSPLLRLEHGAALVREERLDRLTTLAGTLLALAAPRLVRPVSPVAAARVRPKLRLALSFGGGGLVTQVRYFGEMPGDEALCAAFWDAGACPLPPLRGPLAPAQPRSGLRLAAGEVCLRVVASAGPRRLAVVRVMAGPRVVALPVSRIARALAADGPREGLPASRSLARILGEEPLAAAQGRPAVLVLQRQAAGPALRVEALLGHGAHQVLPVGPLLGAVPWLLGVLDEGGGQPPTLVIDPQALPYGPSPEDE